MLLTRRAMLSSALFSGTALTTDQRVVRYYGTVDTPSLLELNTVLAHLNTEDPYRVIDLHVQSPGGELLPASLHDRRHCNQYRAHSYTR